MEASDNTAPNPNAPASAGAPASVLKGTYQQTSLVQNQGVLAELADGTGGSFFHNNNNFDGGFANLLAGPEYLYLMAFSIAGVKPNGAYHKLTVKVAKDGLNVQARRGYFAPKEDTNKK